MRLIEEEDARFVLGLRQDPKFSRYLSAVEDDLEKQIQWLKNYKLEEKFGNQYYFIIETKESRCGTVRLYDFRGDSFCWGSWILNEKKTKNAAIESALLVYRYGFEELNFKKSHFTVRKGNSGVINFHKKLGARVTDQDDENLHFVFAAEQYWALLGRYSKYL